MDIFNLSADDFISQSTQKVRVTDENIFDPDVSQGTNGVYKAILRFIPWHAATKPEEVKYQKYNVKITNPLTKEKFFVDDPSTVGRSSIFWTLDTKLKALKLEEPEMEAQLRKNFSRNYKYYALAYIKKDPQNPSDEGKIKIVPMGYQINNLFEQQLNPQDADLGVSAKVNPFDMLNGKDFVYVAKKKTEFWRDFSSCKFMDQTSPFIITTPAGKQVPFTNDPKTIEQFKKFLVANSPDLSQYFFKEWTPETYKKSVEFLKAAFPAVILNPAMEACRDTLLTAAFKQTPSETAYSGLDEDLDFVPSAPKPTAKSKAATEAESIDSDLNDLLDEPVAKKAATKKVKEEPVLTTEDDDDMFADL